MLRCNKFNEQTLLMKTVAIVTWPYFGHIYPTFSLGANLLAQGFRVVWLCEIPTIQWMLPEGGEFILVTCNAAFDEALKEDQPYGMQSLKDLYSYQLIPKNEILYSQLKLINQTHKFDFIVTDQQAFSGALFAHQYGIPYATSVTAPAAIDPSPEFPEVHEYEKQQVINFQRSKGCMESEALVWCSPITLVYTTELFLQSNQFPADYYFIGPSTSKRKEWTIDISAIEAQVGKQPIVLVSMGSVLPRESGFVDKVIAAFEFQPVTVVLVTAPEIRESWPDNFLVYGFIPQLQVLKLVDAVICHAGHNTVCEALNEGLPLVTIPVAYDQSYVATKVKNAGAGIRLKYRRLKSDDMRSALNSILTEPSFRDSAKKIQKSFQQAGGESQAVALITSFIKRDQVNLAVEEKYFG